MAQNTWETSIGGKKTPAPLQARSNLRSNIISLPRRMIVGVLAASIVSLVLLSLAGQIARYYFDRPFAFGLIDFFYVDIENNLPTWYQSVNFLFAACLLGMIYHSARREGRPFARHWGILALGFAYLSLDEMASLHERLINPLQRIIQPGGAWAPTWVIAGLIGVVIVGLFFLPFLLHLARRQKLQVAMAGALFVGGSIGVEMWTASMFDTTDPNFNNSFRYALMAHLEELLEMVGLLVFIDLLLKQLEGAPAVSIAVAH
jgi:hypothetical protein